MHCRINWNSSLEIKFECFLISSKSALEIHIKELILTMKKKKVARKGALKYYFSMVKSWKQLKFHLFKEYLSKLVKVLHKI